MDKKPLSPKCYLCSSDLEVGQLLSIAKSLSKEKVFVQLLDYEPTFLDRLLPSYANAQIRETENCMKSDSISKEMLLFLSGNMTISKAIALCGIKSTKSFLLFGTDGRVAEKFISEADVKEAKSLELRFDPKIAGEIAVLPL